MTVEQALAKVEQFEAERRRLQEKKAEIEAKRAEIQAKLKETEDEIGQLLVRQVLGELSPEEEKRIGKLEAQVEKLKLTLRGVELALGELERRLSEAEKTQKRVYLEAFAARRDSLLDFLQREIEEHKRLTIKLGLKGKLVNQCLEWLRRWETALGSDLEEAGLEPNKAHQALGPVLSSRLDTKIHLFDLQTKRTDLTFEALWANDPSIVEPWQGELSFIAQVPSCITAESPADLRKCAWRHIREGLGLVSDENQNKEEK